MSRANSISRKHLYTIGSILINGVSLLETKLSNGKPNHVMLVHFHAPLSQDIERRHGPRDASAEVGPHTMADFLAMKNHGAHRQDHFYQHPRVPVATRTDFHVGRIASRGMETGIGQDNHLAVTLGNQRSKMGVVDLGGGTVPSTD